VNSIKTFAQDEYAARLRVPEGTQFVEADSTGDIREALQSGRAAYVESCSGRAFVWKEGGLYKVDHFFFGPPRQIDYESEEDAVNYAAALCA